MKNKIALFIGSGAACLSAAYTLCSQTDNIKPIIIECDDCVGGLAKTYEVNGIKFDLGPHRYFSKEEKVMSFWGNVFPYQGEPSKDDIILKRLIQNPKGNANPEYEDNVMLQRRRFSRIYYENKFYDYPVKMNLKTVLNMGIFKTIKCGLSYIKSCFVKKEEKNLEDFMINRFGKVLYETFFEFYTQKVWGRHPKNISKEWGEQRIKGLSLMKTLLNKLTIKKETSLIEEYYYPKFGSGQMWEEMAKYIKFKGGDVLLNSKVVGMKTDNNRIVSLKIKTQEKEYDLEGDYIISSMPICDLIAGIDNCPNDIRDIAAGLPYRDYQLISYKVNNFNLHNNTDWKTIDNLCPDSWIYIQDRCVNMGRIYIPKNFSPYLSKNIKDTLICLEYFCNKGDKLWNMQDTEIFNYGIEELIKIKAINSKDDIEFSHRLKAEKAYPAYFDTYKDFDKLKEFLNGIENLYCIGRNGQHKYNNMDHSTLSGITVADVILKDVDKTVLWDINTEQSYQESK